MDAATTHQRYLGFCNKLRYQLCRELILKFIGCFLIGFGRYIYHLKFPGFVQVRYAELTAHRSPTARQVQQQQERRMEQRVWRWVYRTRQAHDCQSPDDLLKFQKILPPQSARLRQHCATVHKQYLLLKCLINTH
jgi:hypothetical protein